VFLNILILLFSILCMATAIIFIKLSQEHALLLAAYRVLVAAIVLTPIFLRETRRHPQIRVSALFKTGIIPGLALALHFMSWVIGARMTTSVNASLIITLTPVVMPFLLIYMVQERITRGELLGTIIAVGGGVLLSARDFNFSRQYFWGDVLCFVSMLVYSVYIAFSRKNRHVPSLWLYVVPLYWVAGLFSLGVAAFFVNPIKAYTLREVLFILGLGVIPTVIGHSILNYAMQVLPGQIVSLINMGLFVFVGILAYLILHEIPRNSFYLAALMVVAGASVALIQRTKK
jgi:drug/metabolite transporter (DMT)-like permease